MTTTRDNLFFPAIFMLLFLSLDFSAAQIGIAYGTDGDGLPLPSEVVNIFKRNDIKRMRIYNPFPEILDALRDSGIELTIGVLNEHVADLTARPNADAWVRDNIQKYLPGVSFKHIVIGNEVSPIRNQQYVDFIVPAMTNIHDALAAAGIGGVSVSTAVETELLATNYPPSSGDFKAEVKPYMQSVLQFLVNTNAPLFVNIYTYYALVNGDVSADYALLQPGGGVDTPDGHYDNLYYALVDAMYAAIEKSGVASVSDQGVKNTEIKGSESGWPSGGGAPGGVADQTGAVANPENAQMYINNLIRVVKSGTPRRPNSPIETYIFSMFDESKKEGPDIERNFGIFQPDGQTKFPINFT